MVSKAGPTRANPSWSGSWLCVPFAAGLRYRPPNHEPPSGPTQMAFDIVRHSPPTSNIENRRSDLRFQPLQSPFSRPLDLIHPHPPSFFFEFHLHILSHFLNYFLRFFFSGHLFRLTHYLSLVCAASLKNYWRRDGKNHKHARVDSIEPVSQEVSGFHRVPFFRRWCDIEVL
ncbi:hypothetical protein Csa_004084 [Cucumis sativus]|uniref:Uncharacterized protein n=1 Tax=Cucumis sativus TaxID=3659 RepID=A0A0A0KJP7_CUCSA|nr:hypothetical protein Csa_004084 [Cucumis sativus]